MVSDFDRVEESNLQRQIVHTTERIGMLKVESARQTLHGLNPDCRVVTRSQRLEGAELLQQVQRSDLVIDGSDNFATRFAVNEACVTSRTAPSILTC